MNTWNENYSVNETKKSRLFLLLQKFIVSILNIIRATLANNSKYDTISFVKYGDKPSVAVTSRIVRAVCRPPYFLVFWCPRRRAACHNLR